MEKIYQNGTFLLKNWPFPLKMIDIHQKWLYFNPFHQSWIDNPEKNAVFHSKLSVIVRLNSEDFSKFFLWLDALFLTFSYVSTHSEIQKNAWFFSNFLEYSWFFQLFRGFSYKTFLYSELQLHDMHHKIPHKISHRIVQVTSLRDVETKRYHVFYRFYGGWNLRRFSQNLINLH